MKTQLVLASLVALSLTACSPRDFDREGDREGDGTEHGRMMDDKNDGQMGGYMMGDHMMFITSEEDFIEQMIPHHQEAVDTAQVILARSSNVELKALAQNIVDSQTTEIEQMRSWYLDWFGGAPGTGMYMAMMPNLNDLEGEELDQAFIEGMIEHHEGAIAMAEAVKSLTERPELLTMADAIIAAQTQEVELLKGWLKTDSEEYFSFKLPANWIQEVNEPLDGPNTYNLRSQELMPDGYSCSEDIASVTIAPYIYVDPAGSIDLDTFAFSEGVYDESGSLGAFGGKAEKTNFNGKAAYKYESAGIETPCPASAYLVEDKDYFFQVIVFAKEGGKAQEEAQALLDSITW